MPIKGTQEEKEKGATESPSPVKSPIIGSEAVLALDIKKKLADAVQSTTKKKK